MQADRHERENLRAVTTTARIPVGQELEAEGQYRLCPFLARDLLQGNVAILHHRRYLRSHAITDAVRVSHALVVICNARAAREWRESFEACWKQTLAVLFIC